MLIDWFTVVAQIVNFLVLVALLKYFLYGRVINAMDKREEKIVSRLTDAEEKERRAEEEARSYQEKSREVEEKRGELLARVEEEADGKRKELIRKAREEVAGLEKGWREALMQEQDIFLEELRRHVAREVCVIARRIMKDLASAELETQVVNTFVMRIRDLDKEERNALPSGTGEMNGRLAIVSAFDIGKDDRRKISEALRNTLKKSVDLEFRTSSDMVLGIELRSRDHKLAWTVDDYLGSLEAGIRDVFEEEAREGIRDDEEGPQKT